MYSSGQRDTVPALGASSLERVTDIKYVSSQNKYIIAIRIRSGEEKETHFQERVAGLPCHGEIYRYREASWGGDSRDKPQRMRRRKRTHPRQRVLCQDPEIWKGLTHSCSWNRTRVLRVEWPAQGWEVGRWPNGKTHKLTIFSYYSHTQSPYFISETGGVGISLHTQTTLQKTPTGYPII